MAKPRIDGRFVFNSALNASLGKDAITARLVGKDIFQTHLLSHTPTSGIFGFAAFIDCRLNSVTDRDALWSDFTGIVMTGLTGFQSGVVRRHMCSHDDPVPYPCKESEFQEQVL